LLSDLLVVSSCKRFAIATGFAHGRRRPPDAHHSDRLHGWIQAARRGIAVGCPPLGGGRGPWTAGARPPPSRPRAISSPSATWTPATGRPRSPAAPVRLHAAGRRARFQHHGHRPAVALRPAGHRLGPRSRPGLPRRLSETVAALVPGRVAIIATDIAEVIGTAIGLNLLFGIPLEIGVIITALDVFLILWLQRLGFRWVEALIITLLGVIAVCFAVQIALADPDWGEVIRGFAPTVEIVRNPRCSIWRSASSARR
jgi:uncharacterized membrane protein YqjE